MDENQLNKDNVLQTLFQYLDSQVNATIDQIKEIRNKCNYLLVVIITIIPIALSSSTLIDNIFEKILLSLFSFFVIFKILKFFNGISVNSTISVNDMVIALNQENMNNEIMYNGLLQNLNYIYFQVRDKISNLEKEYDFILNMFICLICLFFILSIFNLQDYKNLLEFILNNLK